jgi:4a-hydroxytetrahydrobiopterin dehydratase
MSDLAQKRCKACEGGEEPLSREQAEALLGQLNDWQISSDGKVLSRDFKFKGFYKTMAFVNAVAWIANQELHHPDMEIGFNHALIQFTTHDIGGLSENDFICAAKIDALQAA